MAAKSTRTKKSTKPAATDLVIVEMTSTVVVDDNPQGNDLDPAILAELDAELAAVAGDDDADMIAADPEGAADVVEVEAKVVPEAGPADPEGAALDDLLSQLGAPTIADAAAAVDAAEAVEIASAAAVVDTPTEGAEPTEGEPVSANPESDAAPAKERKQRVHWGRNKVGRIQHNLGERAGEFAVLTMTDAQLDGDALKAAIDATFDAIRAMNTKEQNRAAMFLEFVGGKKAKLNEVIERTLKVLAADGQIKTGEKGNLMANLLAKPYSLAAARAMGGNTVGMLRDLKVLTEAGKGTFYANPESLLLMQANSLLGLQYKEPPAPTAA